MLVATAYAIGDKQYAVTQGKGADIFIDGHLESGSCQHYLSVEWLIGQKHWHRLP